MNINIGIFRHAMLTLVFVASSVSEGQSALTATLSEESGDVVVTIEGSIAYGSMTQQVNNGFVTNYLEADASHLFIAVAPKDVNAYYDQYGFSTSVVTGDDEILTSFVGDVISPTVGFFAVNLSVIAVPHGYISGTPVSYTMTYQSQTFASMGIAPNRTITHTWTGGGVTDSFTVTTQPVPEPSVSLLCVGAVGVISFRRQRRR